MCSKVFKKGFTKKCTEVRICMRPGWPFLGIYRSISDGKHLKLLKSATEVHVQNYNLTKTKGLLLCISL